MNPKEKALKIYSNFSNYQSAKHYIVLWQDEYINEKDKLYRQKVKQEFDKLCM